MKAQGWRRFLEALQSRLSLPLLGKELAEMAARRRTYVLRIVYALLLFIIFWFTLPNRTLFSGSDSSYLPYQLLGLGRELFERITIIQLFGILLFQPALMCGRITQEKERDSLVLLFLTKLRPWEIVLQKYLGGLVPMFSFLLLSLPLAGVAYAFGGVESHVLVEDAVGLLLLSLQVGALALMCSAWCRTTVSALISSYVVGLVFYAGPPLLGNLLWSVRRAASGYYEAAEYRFLLIPQAAISLARQGTQFRYGFLVPVAVSIILFLLLTRVFLVRRAFVPPFDLLPRLFAWLDRLMKWANRFLGGVVLYRDGASGPADDPIFWRETQRRVLGKPHYLFRLLCALEVPTILVCMLVLFGDYNSWSSSSLSVTAFILGALAMFSLSATAANSIVSERVGQTLEVLLTTPLTATQILRQKERALRRLEWILAVPLITIFGARAFVMGGEYQRRYDESWPYFIMSLTAVLIYLPLITWLSLWIGLRVRTRFQAILAALGTLTGWMALAPILAVTQNDSNFSRWWFLLSPVGLPALNEFDRLPNVGDFESPWPAVITNIVLYTILALVIRWLLFRDAERCLRR